MADLDRGEVLDWAEGFCPAVRNRRKPIEGEWLLNHSAWRGIRTRWYYSDGVSEHYIPAARRMIERYVVRGRQMLVPAPDFFEVYPTQENDPQAGLGAEHARAYLGYLLHKRTRLRSYVDMLLRTFLMYGRAVVKNTINYVETPVVIPAGPGQGTKGTMGRVNQTWPTTRTVDPFVFYVWPETVNSVDEAQVVFEDHMMPVEDYRARAAQGVCDALDYAGLGKPEWPIYHSVRLQESGLTDPDSTQAAIPHTKSPSGASFVALTELWFKREGTWQQAWIAWNTKGRPTVVRYQTSPYPEPPYRLSAARQLPGEHYTSSLMSDLEPQQVWLNDAINLTQDGVMTSMSPPALVDPARVVRSDSLVYRPRAKWLVDPSGVSFPNIPDTSRTGQANVAMILGMMEQFSGTGGPLAEGTPARGSPRAGFALSSLIQLALSDVRGTAELLEDEILTPTLSDLYRLGVVFTPLEQMLALPPIMGLQGRKISMNDLYGDWTFKWVGSLQSQDYQVRAQRLISFMGLLTKLGPLVQQAGLVIDWQTLFKRIWRDGLGERGAETILRTMTFQDAMQQMAAMAAQGQGPVAQAAGLAQNGGPPASGGAPGPAMGAGQAPAPASAEQLGQQISRGMAENAVGAQMQGLRQG